ncbi:hypothetical protein GCM10020331_058530 [Ectobacillus funiculus]
MEPSPAAAEFVELVRQYDTWEWEKASESKGKKMLNDLLYLLSIEEFEEKDG